MKTDARARAALRSMPIGDAAGKLIEHPARLAVFTIDAFAAGLARQAPLSTGLGGAPRYEEHADSHYVAAARTALASADANDIAWRQPSRSRRQRCHPRDPPPCGHAGEARAVDRRAAQRRSRAFRAALEAALAAEVEGELGLVAALFPRRSRASLADH